MHTCVSWRSVAFAIATLAAVCIGPDLFAQQPAQFETASIRVSTSAGLEVIGGRLRGNRYEIRNATLFDLIRLAYDVRPEKIAGGPNWLEWNRYDVTALAPVNAAASALPDMLKSLLSERFQLKIRNGPMTRNGFALRVGSGKLALREAASAGRCTYEVKPEPNGILASNVECRGLSMAQLANGLPLMANQHFSLNQPVVDETGISGIWDFDFKFTATGLLNVAGSSGLSMPLAMERIGLKLEPRPVTVDALTVDSIAERPTPDPADLSKRIPPLPTPAFEIASVKLSPPDVTTGRQQFQQDGRFTASGTPLVNLIRRAWDLRGREYLIAPAWVDSTRVDIDARPIAESVANAQIEPYTLRAMLLPLLVERFKIKYHMEDRSMTAHRLTADRPKLTKADASARTRCVNSFSSTGDRGASQVGFTYTCTNVTMAQLGLLLPEYANDYVQWPVVDATGLAGGWNFAFSFARRGAVEQVRKPTGVGNNAAIEPTAALTLAEALSTQLGLKLQEEKRMVPVLVIDAISEQPADN